MPQPFGVTATGFSCPTEADILALIEADQRAEISATLDVSEASELGKLNRIAARQLASAWSTLEASYHAFDPERAAHDALTSLLKITGAGRRGASHSQVDLTLALVEGTRLEAGTHYAHVIGKPDLRFTLLESFTAPEDGFFARRFRSESTGPIDVPVNSILVIATPVVGWTSIAASGEVEVGRNVDNDADARERREQGLARVGSATVAAIRSDLLALENVSSCQVFENTSDETDANGLPAHSFEAIVTAPNATDDELAQAIWNSRPGGIRSVGSSAGTAIDRNGDPHEMRFSRTDQVEVWITYELERVAGYVGDDAFKAAVAATLDAELQPGEAFEEYYAWTAAHGLGVRVRATTFGLDRDPTTDAPIVIGPRQLARFDAGRIVIA